MSSQAPSAKLRPFRITIVVVCVLLAFGTFAPGSRAAGPTLTIVSPSDNSVIGNGTPVTVIFVVSNFNLTPSGTAGAGPNQGHVDVYVDDIPTMAVSQETVVLPLPSGAYYLLLRLVSDNGTALSPDVSASISVNVTQGPPVGSPRIRISYVEITYPTPGLVLGRDVTISFEVTDFALVPPGRGQPVPNEGHVVVLLDGVYYTAVTAFRPIPFSDLPDGEHTVTVHLVDDAGQPLIPDASDSVRFRIQFAAIVDINPYLSIAQVVLAGAIFVVLFYRDWGRATLEALFARMRGKQS